MSEARGTWKQSPQVLQPRLDDSEVHPGAKWVLRPVIDGEWWNVVESNAALSATAIHKTPACSHPKGCVGAKAGGFFEGGPDGAPVRAAPNGNLPPVMPQGKLVEILGREVRRQRN